MAVTYTLKQGSRTSEQTADWKRKYGVTFICITDDPLWGPGTVRALLTDQYGNKINLGSRYQVWTGPVGVGVLVEQDVGCFATSISAVEDPESDDGLQWLVSVEYGPYDPTTWPLNPLDWPLRISWDQAKFEGVADRDINGDAVVNSAGQLFDPPATRDDSRWVLTIVRNEKTFDPKWADAYKDALNEDDFMGRGPGEWKIDSITSGDPIHDEDSGTKDGFYYAVTYKFAHNPAVDEETGEVVGWRALILDSGYKQVDASSGKLKPILDETGAEHKTPQLLDGNGNALPVDGTPAYMKYDIYKSVKFTDFEFDLTTAPCQNN